MSKPRPFIRKHAHGFYLIHLDRTECVVGTYYTTLNNAATAATRIFRSHR